MADRPADTEGEEDEEEEVPKPQKMAGKVRREMTPLERQINFGAINEAEDADAAFAGENLGVIFEGLAYQVEELAGKGNGGRRAR
jgi:hypothetical protein